MSVVRKTIFGLCNQVYWQLVVPGICYVRDTINISFKPRLGSFGIRTDQLKLVSSNISLLMIPKEENTIFALKSEIEMKKRGTLGGGVQLNKNIS